MWFFVDCLTSGYLHSWWKNKLSFGCLKCFSGTLEGKRERPDYHQLIEDPLLRFSGICQESSSDLFVTCQVFTDGRPVILPVQSSYKPFTKRWKYAFWVMLVTTYALKCCWILSVMFCCTWCACTANSPGKNKRTAEYATLFTRHSLHKGSAKIKFGIHIWPISGPFDNIQFSRILAHWLSCGMVWASPS
jgi:hypothetical protein